MKPLLVLALLLAAPSDLDMRLARWRTVEMPYQAAGLSANDRQTIAKLVEACQYLDQIFWRQSDPQAVQLYRSTNQPALRRLLMIHGGRFDLLDGNRPFAGAESAPPGRGFYPSDLTAAEIERYVKEHPAKREEIYSPYTVVRRRGSELDGVPYRQEYRAFLASAALALRQAAALSADPQFANFLRLRSAALLSDDYYASDMAWLDLKDPRIDVIFAPYESYLDDLLGVKTSYGAAVLIRDDAESRRVAVWERYIPDLQDALPLAAEDRPSKRGLASPMEVVDSPFRSGDLRHGYQAVADNLPNDPRIHERKGSKKIFFKDFLEARVNFIILPIAHRLMRPQDAARVTAEGYMAGTVLHEIAHGLGPAYARRNGERVDIREAIGPLYSGLEEAKADTVGMSALPWLADHGALAAGSLSEDYASYVAGLLRTLRFGTAEAHSVSELMQFNYLLGRHAIVSEAGRYGVDYTRMPAALAALSKELLEIEATGDAARAQRWFHQYSAVPPALEQALHSIDDIPVDLDPVFSFPDKVE
jgi:hypothetical protein